MSDGPQQIQEDIRAHRRTHKGVRIWLVPRMEVWDWGRVSGRTAITALPSDSAASAALWTEALTNPLSPR